MSILTLMFCGPHHGTVWSPMYHRIDHAVAVARETSSPLIVAGDSFGGRAVDHFVERARAARIEKVVGAYHPGGRTLTDARRAIELLRDEPDFQLVNHVLVVTDDWHVDRCCVMLAGEARAMMAGRQVTWHRNRATDAGPRPPPHVRAGENKGIEDYLAGRPYQPFGDPFGKPAHPTS